MKNRTCQICGSELAMIKVTPELYFYINEKGQVERDKNNDFGGLGPFPEFKLICTYDRIHDIWPLLGTQEHNDLIDWCEEFENSCNSLIKKEGI